MRSSAHNLVSLPVDHQMAALERLSMQLQIEDLSAQRQRLLSNLQHDIGLLEVQLDQLLSCPKVIAASRSESIESVRQSLEVLRKALEQMRAHQSASTHNSGDL